ncbi:hypothetical protein AcV7_004094 [Taiwanofungus camphoratus]|nr:hypothetical protein AcV7_004094 [Antrodia cinnamomea]
MRTTLTKLAIASQHTALGEKSSVSRHQFTSSPLPGPPRHEHNAFLWETLTVDQSVTGARPGTASVLNAPETYLRILETAHAVISRHRSTHVKSAEPLCTGLKNPKVSAETGCLSGMHTLSRITSSRRPKTFSFPSVLPPCSK